MIWTYGSRAPNYIYRERRILVTESLESLGFDVYQSNATMFVWAKIPLASKKTSMDFSLAVLEKSNVAIIFLFGIPIVCKSCRSNSYADLLFRRLAPLPFSKHSDFEALC